MSLPIIEHDDEYFEMACNLFTLLTTTERLHVLEAFARLRYPSVADRFFEAVYLAIVPEETLSQEEG